MYIQIYECCLLFCSLTRKCFLCCFFSPLPLEESGRERRGGETAAMMALRSPSFAFISNERRGLNSAPLAHGSRRPPRSLRRVLWQSGEQGTNPEHWRTTQTCTHFDRQRGATGPCARRTRTRVLGTHSGTADSGLLPFKRSSLPSLFPPPLWGVSSDPGRGTPPPAAEPERRGVDLAARGPLACGRPPRASYSRVHRPGHQRRAAAAAGEPGAEGKPGVPALSQTLTPPSPALSQASPVVLSCWG